MSEPVRCQLCGEPMPPGEEMFNYHGYSGPCPKPRHRYEPSDDDQYFCAICGKSAITHPDDADADRREGR